MCKYCDGDFVGDKPICALTNKETHGIEIIVENGFIYAYCKCGRKSVVEINYCPMCGEKLN